MKKIILPTVSACFVAFVLATMVLVGGFYALWENFLPVCEDFGSPFWGTVIFCSVLIVFVMGASIIYELISRRYSEISGKKASDD